MVAMLIRVACIFLAVIVPLGLFTFMFAAGAIFLPYFAVIIANAQGSQSNRSATRIVDAPTLSISTSEFRQAKYDAEKEKDKP
jgi:predicted tellurium resistance membrane protein TerC